ncbi:MAG: ABC transporter ATP-binding protein [Selenomonadaceae bacterium]|nr:ABC transporter ATP-binding protein [Selenomonadaceae bacterium]
MLITSRRDSCSAASKAALQLKLVVEKISKAYDKNSVLRQVSFDVRDGEFFSILGSSGCGKTTLLQILIGLLDADDGKIFKDGTDITNLEPARRGMGIVFQNYALFDNMTVFKNVSYALKFHGVDESTAQKKSAQMLDIVGLKKFSSKMPAELSGGQQQRVAIARALALEPDIILFDEPLSALDASTRLDLRRALKNIQKTLGTTMIYVTHDQEEAFALSERVMILNRGVVSQIGTPEEIISSPANNYVQNFVVDNLQTKIDSLRRFLT